MDLHISAEDIRFYSIEEIPRNVMMFGRNGEV